MRRFARSRDEDVDVFAPMAYVSFFSEAKKKRLRGFVFFLVKTTQRKETTPMAMYINKKTPKLFIVYGCPNTGKTTIIKNVKETMLTENGWEDVTDKCGVDVSEIAKNYLPQQSEPKDIFSVLKKNDVLIGLFSEGDYPKLWFFIWILIFIIGCSGVVIATSVSEKILPFVVYFKKIQKHAGLENIEFFTTKRYRNGKNNKKDGRIKEAVLKESERIFKRIEENFITRTTVTEEKNEN